MSSIYTVEIDQIDESSWGDLIRQFDDADFYQNWPYDAVMWGARRVSHLVLRKQGDVVAAAQVRILKAPILNAGMAYVLRGPMWRRRGEYGSDENQHDDRVGGAERAYDVFSQAIGALRDEYAGKRGLLLRILPKEIDDGSGAIRSALEAAGFERRTSARAYRTLVLDLAAPLEKLRKGLQHTWRTNLNKAQARPFQITIGSDDDLYTQFAALYGEMYDRKRSFTAVDLERFRQIQRRLPDPLKMRIAVCALEGEPVAAAVCSTVGETALEIFLATGQKALETQGAFALIWRQLEWLKEQGIRYFDFGGIDPEANPGGYRFKRGLSGADVTHVGEFDAPGSRLSGLLTSAAEDLRLRYQKARLWLSNLPGAFRSRNGDGKS